MSTEPDTESFLFRESQHSLERTMVLRQEFISLLTKVTMLALYKGSTKVGRMLKTC